MTGPRVMPHMPWPPAANTGALGGADERQAVDGAGARADPLVLAVVEVGTAQQRAGGLGDGLDAALVERGLGLAELHHPGDAQAVADRRAGNALRPGSRPGRWARGRWRRRTSSRGRPERRFFTPN